MKLFTSIALLLCLFVCTSNAQPKQLPDSIRLEFPEYQSLITFELRKYTENKTIIKDFPAQLAGLLSHIKSSITEPDMHKPQHIEVIFNNDDDAEKYIISLHEIIPAHTKVTVDRNVITELLPPGWELTIKMKEAEIHVYAPTVERLEELTRLNLEHVVAHLDNHPETHRQKRFGIISRIVVKEGSVLTDKTTHRLPYDMLGLHAGAGVGVLQDKIYPEFNFTTSFYFANRYRKNFQRISAHYELKLFSGRSPEGEYQSRPASFLSVSYALNFRKDRPRWTGIGAGFMVNNKSDLFTGKTMKLFLESDIGSSKLNIIPELYLTDDYKTTVFGIKLNYKF
ncbi:MAG: hypothetical protein KF845_03730 [Cyclobacteriaceae bacterium]|nr:hypothetical protein [Cyclobacteriaceae bacterium]